MGFYPTTENLPSGGVSFSYVGETRVPGNGATNYVLETKIHFPRARNFKEIARRYSSRRRRTAVAPRNLVSTLNSVPPGKFPSVEI